MFSPNPLKPITRAIRDIKESGKRIGGMLGSVASAVRQMRNPKPTELDEVQQEGVKIPDSRARFEYYAQARGVTPGMIKARISASRRVQSTHLVAAVAAISLAGFVARAGGIVAVLCLASALVFMLSAGVAAWHRTQLQERDLSEFSTWFSRRDALMKWIWPLS